MRAEFCPWIKSAKCPDVRTSVSDIFTEWFKKERGIFLEVEIYLVLRYPYKLRCVVVGQFYICQPSREEFETQHKTFLTLHPPQLLPPAGRPLSNRSHATGQGRQQLLPLELPCSMNMERREVYGSDALIHFLDAYSYVLPFSAFGWRTTMPLASANSSSPSDRCPSNASLLRIGRPSASSLLTVP